QRDDFGVIAPFVLMETFANDLAVAHNQATNVRIGAGQADAFARQGQRVFRETNVVCVHELVEQRAGVGFRVEGNQVVDLLASADEADGQREFARDGHHDSALGGGVELGENDAGDPDGGGEFARLRQSVLAGGGVE